MRSEVEMVDSPFQHNPSNRHDFAAEIIDVVPNATVLELIRGVAFAVTPNNEDNDIHRFFKIMVVLPLDSLLHLVKPPLSKVSIVGTVLYRYFTLPSRSHTGANYKF